MGDAEGRPSFRDVFDALTPPGYRGSDLFEALKAAQATPPPGTAPDITLFQPEGRMRHCINCGATHDYMASCFAPGGPVSAPAPAAQPPSLPADPFSPGHVAGVGLTEMLNDMTAGGMPLASAERILGVMLAAHAIMTAALEGNRDQS